MIHEVQYPQRQGPVTDPAFFPVPFNWTEAPQRQKFPRRWAQQPPSYAGVVCDPSLFPLPSFRWSEAPEQQKFPRRWAQQPNALVSPVMIITPVVVTGRRRFAVIY